APRRRISREGTICRWVGFPPCFYFSRPPSRFGPGVYGMTASTTLATTGRQRSPDCFCSAFIAAAAGSLWHAASAPALAEHRRATVPGAGTIFGLHPPVAPSAARFLSSLPPRIEITPPPAHAG